MVLSSAITIAGDRRSVFPYDRRRSQNFLQFAIVWDQSCGNQVLDSLIFSDKETSLSCNCENHTLVIGHWYPHPLWIVTCCGDDSANEICSPGNTVVICIEMPAPKFWAKQGSFDLACLTTQLWLMLGQHCNNLNLHNNIGMIGAEMTVTIYPATLLDFGSF